MKKIGMFILTLSVLLLFMGSAVPASANGTIVNGETDLVEGILLSEEENEISPLFIPCNYYLDGNHRYVKTGQREVQSSPQYEQVTVKRPDGSLEVKTCTIYNFYTVMRYTCPCGDSYDSAGTFSRTSHSVNH